MIVRKAYRMDLLSSLSFSDLRALYQRTLAMADPRRRLNSAGLLAGKKDAPR